MEWREGKTNKPADVADHLPGYSATGYTPEMISEVIRMQVIPKQQFGMKKCRYVYMKPADFEKISITQ